MLKSLFGDLNVDTPRLAVPGTTFQATRLQRSTRNLLQDDGRLTEHIDQDVFVSGSPAQAMRNHLAAVLPSDGHQVITLLDSEHRLAPRLIRSLSAATGQPVQRLNIRDHASQHVMVTLERTLVPRGAAPALKLYHADVPSWQGERAPVDDSATTPFVLMESSSMAVVVVSTMTPAAADDLLVRLALATQAPSWRCPTLVFVLTEQTAWVTERIRGMHWPVDMQLDVVHETLASPMDAAEATEELSESGVIPATVASVRATSASPAAVWNALLEAWDRHDLSNLPPADMQHVQATDRARAVARALRGLMTTPGILGCAVADVESGALVAGESHDATIHLTQACAALAPLVRAQQVACGLLDAAAPFDEMFMSAGPIQYVVRSLPAAAGWFLFARIDRAKSNLTLVRHRLGEAQQALD